MQNPRSNDLQLDWLRAFIAAVDGGSLATACRVVYRSPAAISMQIMKLERAAGGKLLIRDTRQFALTPLGMRFVQHARTILQAHAAAISSLNQTPLSGQVRFGFPEDYAAEHLGPVLRRFSQLHSAVEVAMVCAQSTVLIPNVQNGEIDVALVTQDRPSRGTKLFDENYVWVAEPSSQVWLREPLPIAMFEENSMARKMPEQMLRRAKIKFRMAYQSPSTVGLLAVVQSGLAVAAIKRSSCPDDLIQLDHRHGLPALSQLQVAAVISPHARNDPAAKALYEQVVSMLRRV
jgi:DNA-binding transcriptional LysR family regulator